MPLSTTHSEEPSRAAALSRIPSLTRTSLLIALVLSVFALAGPSPAPAANACWEQLVNDYWTDGRIDRVYPIACYREAMEKLPTDVQEYSDAQDELRRAMLGAIRVNRGGGGFDDPEGGGDGTAVPPAPVDSDEGQPKGFFATLLDSIGPKNADSIPVPLLILAGIALLLLGAAATSYVARWYQARRVQMAPSPAPPHDPQG
jgi:hypothetical protein